MEYPEKTHHQDGVEYLKGCPLCEGIDRQLERELHAFAQLLFDIWVDKHHPEEASGDGNLSVDIEP